jgi:hypothetical protein
VLIRRQAEHLLFSGVYREDLTPEMSRRNIGKNQFGTLRFIPDGIDVDVGRYW